MTASSTARTSAPTRPAPSERDGCPEEDKDGDGIVDSKDKCPDEAEDKDGFEDEDGCPDPDNDKDGVPDEQDKCPNEPETKNGYQDDDGCPDEVPVAVKKFTGVVKGINFRRNSADIKASSFPLLKEAVKVFREYPDLRVEISGHTSTEGKRDFNMKLSRKRAESVKGFLVSAGIDEKRIGTVGYGPDRPIADNETKEGKRRTAASSSACCRPHEKVETQPEPEDINPSPERKAKARARATEARPTRPRATSPKPTSRRPTSPQADKAEKPTSRPTRARARARKTASSDPEDEPMPK